MAEKSGIPGLGYVTRSARRLGLTPEQWLERRSAGEKWCTRCQKWHATTEFGTDPNAYDGLNASCRASFRVPEKRYHATRGTTGFRHAPETRERMSSARRGKGNSRWKGGVTPAHRRARTTRAYYTWRRAVLERDNDLCQVCRDPDRRDLRAHHLKPFSSHPELRYVVENGQTQCVACHQATHRKERDCG